MVVARIGGKLLFSLDVTAFMLYSYNNLSFSGRLGLYPIISRFLRASTLLIVFSLSIHSFADTTNATNISVYIHADGGKHRENVREMLLKFDSQHQNISVVLYFSRGVEDYTTRVEKWLESGQGPNIFWWVGGSRVDKLAKQGLIHDLSDYWQTNPNKSRFSATILDTAIYEDKLYGLPVSSSIFALYYRKSVFGELGLNVPNSWQELIESCQLLRSQQRTMFALGTKETQWILHGWFDYLNLRLHGLAFYQKLLAGKIAYTHNNVRTTLLYYKQLVDNQCFNQDHADYSTWDVFPSIIRGYSAMILASGLPEQVHFKDIEDIGISQFPSINSTVPNYTVAPVDVFVVPYYTQINSDVKLLLDFLSTEDFQKAYVEKQQIIPAITIDSGFSTALVAESNDILQQSPGGIQYFDRDADIDFSSQTPQIFVDFLADPNVNETMKKLEALRLKVFRQP